MTHQHVPVQIITFFFEYLGSEKFAANKSSLLFVGGAMTFLLSQLAGSGKGKELCQ